jgi:Holliday junction DNA helicase RuvB
MRLDYFSDADLAEILRRSSSIWDLVISDKALTELAERSRGTARIAIRLLKRVRDYAFANGAGKKIDLEVVEQALNLLKIDKLGLEEIDRKILKVIYKHFGGGPVGLSTLASAVSEDVNTTADVYEPFLIKVGLLKRTSRGRVLTNDGVVYVERLLSAEE